MPTTSGYAGAAADDNAIGTIAWIDEVEATLAPDATCSDVTMSFAELSHYLRCSTFGLSVPSGATVDTLDVTVRARAIRSIGSIDGHILVRIKLPSGSFSPQIGFIAIPTDNTLRDYSFSGYSSTTFGIDPSTLTESIIEDTTLAVVIYSNNQQLGDLTVAVDSVHLSVDYTPTVVYDDNIQFFDDRMEIKWPPSRRFCFAF